MGHSARQSRGVTIRLQNLRAASELGAARDFTIAVNRNQDTAILTSEVKPLCLSSTYYYLRAIFEKYRNGHINIYLSLREQEQTSAAPIKPASHPSQYRASLAARRAAFLPLPAGEGRVRGKRAHGQLGHTINLNTPMPHLIFSSATCSKPQ